MACTDIQHANFDASKCYRAFRLLAWVLLPCGINLKNDIYSIEKTSRFCKIVSNIITGIFIAFCLAFFISITYSLTFCSQSLTIICFFVNTLCFNIDVAVFRTILIKRNIKLKAIFKILHSSCNEILKDNVTIKWPVHKIITYYINGCFVSILVLIVFCIIVDACYQTANDVTPAVVLDDIPAETNASFYIFFKPFMSSFLDIGSFVVVMYHLFFVILYSSLCLNIVIIFNHLPTMTIMHQKQWNTGSSQMTLLFQRRLIKDFIKGHQMMCDVVKMMDDLFKESVAIWDLFEFISVIFSLRVFNIGNEEQSIDQEVALLILLLVITLILKTSLAARINEQVGCFNFKTLYK